MKHKYSAIIVCLLAAAMLLLFVANIGLADQSVDEVDTAIELGILDEIKPWANPEDEEKYLFIPGYCEGKVSQENIQKTCGADGDVNIMYGAQIRVCDITIEDEPDYLQASKENVSSGDISVINSYGHCYFAGKLQEISGRGNSSWEYQKKPYKIKLKKAGRLLDVESCKDWYLLPIWREGCFMTTKLAFDLSQELGMDSSLEADWVDLYINGEYQGLYIVCSDRNIDAEYIIEKDLPEYYEDEEYGFTTASGDCYSIKYPAAITQDDVDNIQFLFQCVENDLEKGTPNYLFGIDLPSIADHFLIDEISLNIDAGVTSMFFYKEPGSTKIYSGPVWDYDSAFGNCNSGWMEGMFVDYDRSILDGGRENFSNIYTLLWRDKIFRVVVRYKYSKLLPYLYDMAMTGIDEYADYIRSSANMDLLRYSYVDMSGDYRGNYESFDDNVRYLKYFLTHRIQSLNERYNINTNLDMDALMDSAAGTNSSVTHTIHFIKDNQELPQMILRDGVCVSFSDMPELDPNKYYGWYWDYSQQKYRDKLPIYEDCTFYARAKDDN